MWAHREPDVVGCTRCMKITAAAIRAFALRDRTAVQQAKRSHWARTLQAAPEIGVALSHALYAHVKALSPDFPSQHSRDEDLAHHIRVKGLLDRVARSIALRRRAR